MTTAAEIQTRAAAYALLDVHWKSEDGTHIGLYERVTNDSPEIRELLARSGISIPAAWCMAVIYGRWIWRACEDFDIPHPLAGVEHKALVQSVVDWATREGRLIGRGDRIVGDIACYSFPRADVEPEDTPYNHAGLVRNVEPFETIEGNTYRDDGDDDAGDPQRGEREGYEVEVKPREMHYVKPTLFIRWADDVEDGGGA